MTTIGMTEPKTVERKERVGDYQFEVTIKPTPGNEKGCEEIADILMTAMRFSPYASYHRFLAGEEIPWPDEGGSANE